MEHRACIMTSAPDMNGNRFSVEIVELAYTTLDGTRLLEIDGPRLAYTTPGGSRVEFGKCARPLTKVWLQTTPDGDKELWVAWNAPAPRGARKE